ncbi:MAG: tetratricopeptide repeat protein [Rhodoferax sp.]|nr:tetratricopeptide repeat protein [Rhodoferax sp.]
MTSSLLMARADSVDAHAVARVRAALQAHMHDPVRWLAYIDALLQSGQPLTARSVLTQALQRGLQGSEVEAMIARVSMLATDGVDWDASACAVPVESVTDGSVAAFWNRQVPDAPEMDRLLELLAQGRHEAVRQQALALTQRAPLHGFGWKLLGMALQQQGRLSGHGGRAARFMPVDAEAHSNLGTALDLQGLFDEAELSLRRALALNPGLAQAHNNLGRVLQSLGRLDEAGRCYRRANWRRT